MRRAWCRAVAIIVATLVLSATRAAAQDSHYWDREYGTTSARKRQIEPVPVDEISFIESEIWSGHVFDYVFDFGNRSRG